MDFKEYQELAYRTANQGLTKEQALANAAMGLAGEAGEICDYLKKVLFHGHTLDLDRLSKELGDLNWYVAYLCTQTGLDLPTVWAENIAKLKARYPAGHFDSQASINRKE